MKIIQSHYVPLERPYRIIYANGNVGLQIGTLIAVSEDESRSDRVTVGIYTNCYPVVSYINKKMENKELLYSDLGFGGGFSEAVVWDHLEQKEVSTFCIEGGYVRWDSLLNILNPRLQSCMTYDENVEELVKIMEVIRTIKELGGHLMGPDIESAPHEKLSDGSIRVIVPLTCQREAGGTLTFSSPETVSMLKYPFQFFAQTKDMDEAVKIIKRQESFYRRILTEAEPDLKISIVYDDDRRQPENGSSELHELVWERLKKERN